jgi:DNA-binding transcriptional LysR family regulator
MLIKWISILFLVLLSSCQPKFRESPLPPPDIWKVKISSSLGWLEPAVNTCTLAQPGKGIIIIKEGEDLIADMILQWNTETPVGGTIAEIGWDELSIVVHPDNPLQALSIGDLQSIFSGKIRSWEQVNQPGQISGEIVVWVNPPEDEISKGFADIFSFQPSRNPQNHVAPSPSSLRQAISSNPLGIGYLPAHWLDNSIRSIPVQGIPSENLRRPILGLFPQEPMGPTRIWLTCLQDAMSKSTPP